MSKMPTCNECLDLLEYNPILLDVFKDLHALTPDEIVSKYHEDGHKFFE